MQETYQVLMHFVQMVPRINIDLSAHLHCFAEYFAD